MRYLVAAGRKYELENGTKALILPDHWLSFLDYLRKKDNPVCRLSELKVRHVIVAGVFGRKLMHVVEKIVGNCYVELKCEVLFYVGAPRRSTPSVLLPTPVNISLDGIGCSATDDGAAAAEHTVLKIILEAPAWNTKHNTLIPRKPAFVLWKCFLAVGNVDKRDLVPAQSLLGGSLWSQLFAE